MSGEAAIAKPDFVEVAVQVVHQPLGVFYVGVMEAKDLKLISYADTRRQRAIESYTGIQRELNKTREKEIKEYVNSFDASFPNSFILAIDSANILEQTDTFLRIRKDEGTAKIIDGQHRLSGFNDLTTPESFQLVVSIFIDLEIEDQAMLFATINLKQTKVSPSLVYDLYEETKLRSPQKTAHNISKALNTDTTSALYHRIKPLGKKDPEYGGVLTQAAVVKTLLPLISAQPDKAKDDIKRRVPLAPNDPMNANCIFWKYFVDDKDWAMLKVINNYLSAVAATFPEDWVLANNSPLPRTIGFQAVLRLLPALFQIGVAEKSLEQAFFARHLEPARGLAPFTFAQYPASGAGETRLYEALRASVFRETASAT